MHIKEIITHIESSADFKDWRKQHPDAYLVHVFRMDDSWQVGYTTTGTTVTSFVMEGDSITIRADEDVFQEKKHTINPLDMEKVSIDFETALKIAETFQKEKAPGNDPQKTFVVLQTLATHTMYNVTFVTRAMNTLNIKIDAETSKVIDHEITPLLNFRGKAS